MHAKVRVGVGVHSKLKGSTVVLKDFQIRILNSMKIRSVVAKFLKWVPKEDATLRSVLQECQRD